MSEQAVLDTFDALAALRFDWVERHVRVDVRRAGLWRWHTHYGSEPNE